MKRTFAVIRSHGPAWQSSIALEEQKEWPAHASFMDALCVDGFVVLGGPLEGTSDVLLIMRAESPEEIVQRLEKDPWTGIGLLVVQQIWPWTVRLGTVP